MNDKVLALDKYHTEMMTKLEQENAQLKAQLKIAVDALEFYADKKGQNWGACMPNDTYKTCCHMVSEISGGESARKALEEIEKMGKS